MKPFVHLENNFLGIQNIPSKNECLIEEENDDRSKIMMYQKQLTLLQNQTPRNSKTINKVRSNLRYYLKIKNKGKISSLSKVALYQNELTLLQNQNPKDSKAINRVRSKLRYHIKVRKTT